MAKRTSNMKRGDIDLEVRDNNNAAEAYEEYLLLLQQRNRLLSKLKEKDEKQLELERKEQGFSLYLNGANVGLQLSGQKSRQTKTAGEYSKREIYKSDIARSSNSRAKTAPTKITRKGWDQQPMAAIKIKTETGDKVTLDNRVYSGKYSEDFELDESCLQSTQKSKSDGEEDYYSHSDEEDEDEDISDNELTFMVQDVKALRRSLENDLRIRKSIANISEELSNSDSEETTLLDETDISEELSHDNEKIVVEEEQEEYSFNDEKVEEKLEIQNDHEGKILELSARVSTKDRPISASQKRPVVSIADSILPKDVSAAIEEENKRILEYQQRRKAKTAPSQETPYEKNLEDRPETISSNLTDTEILSITQRVRALTGRQQKKLLKMLSDIDSVGDDLNDSWDIRKDTNKQFLQEEKNNRKTEKENSVVNDVDKSEVDCNFNFFSSNILDSVESKTSTPSSLSCEETEYSSRPTSGCESLAVTIQLLSNWGSKNFVGLTEIQFFDCANKLIKVYSDDIDLIGTSDSIEYLRNLVNSKTKTTKDKYMWKCQYCSDDDEIKLDILLRGCEYSKLGKILIWNYNRNLQEINVGVKGCKIFINNQLKWQGEIEKGCGNQIFDYSTTIYINSESKTVVSSEVIVAKNPLPDNTKLPTVKSSDDSTKKENVSEIDLLATNPIKLSNDLKSTVDVGKAQRTPLRSSSTISKEKKSPGEEKAVVPVDKSADSKRAERRKKMKESGSGLRTSSPVSRSSSATGSRSSSATGNKPIWLEDSPKVKDLKDNSDLFLEGKKLSLSRPPSVARSRNNTPDFIDPLPVRRPISGRRSQCNSADSDDMKINKEMEDLFDLDSMPVKRNNRDLVKRKAEDNSSSVTPTFSSSPRLLDMPTKKSERSKFKEIMDTNLELSLQSINNFNCHHMGRITASIDDKDDLMSLLEPMKTKDIAALHGKSVVPDFMIDDGEVNEDEKEVDVLFDFPILPQGKELIINIKSTWGDRHYVGLNGIEVFSKSGQLIKVKSIRADPSDINVLPEFDGDPRVVCNLNDGCYLTRDDMHLWLTPFTDNGDHFLELEFEEEAEVAMIRIWNYNKSRIHSTRGARFIEMALDGKLIFIGEIARASGVLSKEDPYGDIILFTTDEDILLNIANNDFTYEVEPDDEEDYLMTSNAFAERPKTANKTEQPTERPFTCPKSRQNSTRGSERDLESSQSQRIFSPGDGFMQCKELTIFFCETWADQHYLGLTGLEVLGETFEAIPLELRMMDASPKDLNDLDDYDDDDRTLDKLLNGINVTTSDENMWMIPFDEDGTHVLKIMFDEYTIVTGLRIWNYNKSLEDTFRGAKTIHIYLDDHIISPQDGFLLRKGPGHCHFDFAQDLLFNNPDALSELQYPESTIQRKINLQNIVNEYETLMMPSGFVFQFKLFSSWGDQYYIGLNGIEVYDKAGEKVKLSDNNITAYPHSVNILAGVEDDVRTPDKLVNGIYDTYDGRQMWLAPILPGQVNIVYIVFDEPITISMIKLWNYSKTPARGVRNFGFIVDDLLVYSGVLPQPLLHSRTILPGLQLPVQHYTILFTDNEEIALKERKHVLSSTLSFPEQNIQLTNDRAILNPYKNKKEPVSEADPAMRPMTSVTSKVNRDRR